MVKECVNVRRYVLMDKDLNVVHMTDFLIAKQIMSSVVKEVSYQSLGLNCLVQKLAIPNQWLKPLCAL